MKSLIVFLCLLFTGIQAGQAGGPLDGNVRWDYHKTPLIDILRDIENAAPLAFSYGNIKVSQPVSIQYTGPLSDGLDQLLTGQGIVYKAIGDQIVLKYGEIKGQDVKGRLLDADGSYPLIGATVVVISSDPLVGTTTNEEGLFRLSGLTVGRYDLRVDYLGYEPLTVPQVLVSTGKEVFLDLALQESALELEEVVIVAGVDKSKPVNEMATLSARTFSVEETRRFAASISDPARMAQSYAGVSSGGDDLSNEIIIRGNSARGLLWRLEGVEIPSPNHFGDMGSGGGAVSMLSASTLATSDFYTGAFPAEFGNALSGVFDLKMRTGNADKREYSIMFGNLGLEAALEGPFKKGGKATYLANYRFSTLGFMGKFLPSLQDIVPAYQDLSFKINVPTDKAGTFTIFGLGGVNTEDDEGIRDSTQWEGGGSHYDYYDKSRTGVIGLTHTYLFKNDRSYLKSALSGSAYTFYDITHYLIASDGYKEVKVDETNFRDYAVNASVTFNHKFDAANRLRAGLTITDKIFNYRYDTREQAAPNWSNGITEDELGDWLSFFRNRGNSVYLESFVQHKYRFAGDWTLNAGVNFSWLFLNNTFAVDPRVGLSWQFRPDQALSLAVGLHSRPEHTSTYLMERIDNGVTSSPNLNLEMTKAFHAVAGYDLSFKGDFRLKAEAYFQYLFHVPVSRNPASGFSVLNSAGVFDIIYMNDINGEVLVSEGTGMNFGLDLTLEKFFTKGYYFLVTGSVFDSRYATVNGEYYHTAYANNFLFNALGGKEFTVGRKKKSLLAINAKFTFYDGRRQTPIDLEASQEAGYTVFLPDAHNTEKLRPYYRFDAGIAYTINAPRCTHSFMFDVQNLTNHYNVYAKIYDNFSGKEIEIYQNGAVPVVNYRVEF